MLCDTCSNRDLCTSLCPEAELYVKQDHVPQKEEPIGILKPHRWPKISNLYLTRIETSIVSLKAQGLTIIEISQILNISRNSVDQHIHRIKQKM
jgi:DNA-binding NarL/FixJ family response regulator